jgi:hypothetical protein
VYSLLETTINTRDLGGYRIDGTDTYTRYGRIIRSDVVLKPSDTDEEYFSSVGIRRDIQKIIVCKMIS